MKTVNRETKYENIKNSIRGMKYGALILVLLSVVLTGVGINKFNEYCYYRDTVIPIYAVVTDIDEVDDDGDTDYRIYVSYEYNGTKVVDAKVGTYDKCIASVGETVTIKISSLNPKYIFKNKNGLIWFGLAVLLLAIALYQLTEMIHKAPRTGYEDTRLITDEMVANDLKPQKSVFLSKVLICFGGCFVIGSYILPDLFRDDSRDIGITVLIICMFFVTKALVGMMRISKRRYSLNIHSCNKQWSEESGDSTYYYTSFSEIGKVSGNYGVIGKRYYIVLDHRRKLRQIYDIGYWQPFIEDKTLHNGSIKIVKNLFVDLMIVLTALLTYIGIIYAIIMRF